MGNVIDLKAADGHRFSAYVAQPSDLFRGAIIVIQEIFGVNSHIRSVADGYAQDGYLALAPALFDRVKRGVELGYSDADVQTGFGLKNEVEHLPAPGAMADIQAAIGHARQTNAAGKVGIVGYCWGGLLSWRAACLADGLSAAVTYYGGGMTSEEEAARDPKVPVLSHFGEQDSHIPNDSVEAFKKKHPEVDVRTYPAQHGFNCDQRGSWDEAAAKKARERSIAFFGQHLG